MAVTPTFEVPAEMRDLAASNVERAQKAFGTFMATARQNADLMEGAAMAAETNARNMYARGFEYAEQNVRAAFDLAQRLAQAGSVQEAMQVQAEFVRDRFGAMQAQSKEFGGMVEGAMRQGAEHARTVMREGTRQVEGAVREGEGAAREMAHEAQDAAKT